MRILFLIFLLFSTPAIAADVDYLQPYFKKPPVEMGEGKYFYAGVIHAFDIKLLTTDGKFNWNKPFAVQLTYKTDIDGDDIADKITEKMNIVEKIDPAKSAQWQAEMTKIIPDVEDGTVLSSVNIPGRGVVFLKSGQKIGEIRGSEFARDFFEIWISPKTPDPDLRTAMLGEGK